MIIQSTNLTLNVKQLSQSIAFYESIGMKITNRWGDHYAQLAAPGIVIGLHPTNEKNVAGHSGNASIGFTTADFEGAKKLLQALGIEATDREEEGGQFIHFKDPDGTALYFIKPKW